MGFVLGKRSGKMELIDFQCFAQSKSYLSQFVVVVVFFFPNLNCASDCQFTRSEEKMMKKKKNLLKYFIIVLPLVACLFFEKLFKNSTISYNSQRFRIEGDANGKKTKNFYMTAVINMYVSNMGKSFGKILKIKNFFFSFVLSFSF